MAGSEPAIWEAKGEDKRVRVQQMFADIAPRYDMLNGIMSLRQHHKWRRLAAAKLDLRPGDAVLDMCCGTGDFLPILREKVGPGGAITALDFCEPMLAQSQPKDPAATLVLGDATNLPLADNLFRGVTVGWGIRNVPDIDAAHREAFRVLQSGGTFVSVDMARPRNPLARVGSFVVNKIVLPVLGAIFRKREAYTYLPESTARFLDREGLRASMERAGFVDVRMQDLFMGNICIHWGRKA
ncbi:MAG: ubiquinone/menaquinone biosynthesis methyltransferase [Chthonomonas sp.]|nr:ubiquinone/menaquinone biosynthesis methyltransferase [Chthonomonas sp.]